MNPLLQRLKAHWIVENPNMNFGINEAEIQTWEQQHNLSLPQDFREYLKFVCSPDELGVDDGWLYFWPFSKMQTVAEYYNKASDEKAQSLLVFADFMIISHHYAVELSSTSSASAPIYIVESDKQVAISLSEFIELHLSGDEEIIIT